MASKTYPKRRAPGTEVTPLSGHEKWLAGQAMVGIDFETYCELDLTKVGIDQYTSHPSFRPLICSVVFDDDTCQTLDFVNGWDGSMATLRLFMDKVRNFSAHNSDFEQAVLRALKIATHGVSFLDSSVVARCHGAASKLEHAAPQLLGGDEKMEAGRHLIRLFSMAPEAPTPAMVAAHAAAWDTFKRYCEKDAWLSQYITYTYRGSIPARELYRNNTITTEMNFEGWTVDLESVKLMQQRYRENQEAALLEFRNNHDPLEELNLNSLKQLKEWCLVRGVRATSFDEEHVASLLERIEKKLNDPTAQVPPARRVGYTEVRDMLKTKQILGGASLKKLQVILDTTGPDGRLRHQYVHAGAGQTYRTSGRGVQMQNLKRLAVVKDMATLDDPAVDWTTDELAENIRQVFTARSPRGALIVADYSSIESRGLAYLAGEKWKLDSYFAGMDLYKVLASKIVHVPYEDITKTDRQSGKVGELSCGYGAAGPAVAAFASKMGIPLSEDEASKIVSGWRASNPMIVSLWSELDALLKEALASTSSSCAWTTSGGVEIRFVRTDTPETLRQQHPGAHSIAMEVSKPGQQVLFRRVFHGCYIRGRNVCYYKPDAKNGRLWSSDYLDPKTKQRRFYELYGGKLAGILTQSFCRELFFAGLDQVFTLAKNYPELTLIGQFHDEVVVDWNPDKGDLSLNDAMLKIDHAMTSIPGWENFPFAAEVKSDYRYTK